MLRLRRKLVEFTLADLPVGTEWSEFCDGCEGEVQDGDYGLVIDTWRRLLDVA